MSSEEIMIAISKGRTDFIFGFLKLPSWKELLMEGPVRLLKWLVYYNDVTALKAVLEAGGNLSSISLDQELMHAAFFGHWKVCDFLIQHGADVNASLDDTHETPLHSALCKAGRPYYFYTIRLLIECGANVNVKTVPGISTHAFMRDVRTKGETPLHRAAAYADARTISYLLEHGADKRLRDCHGNSPLSWASEHLRPGEILSLLSFDEHRISDRHASENISDHGLGWGNAMDWKLFGDYVAETK
jgi:uncharacterized protein